MVKIAILDEEDLQKHDPDIIIVESREVRRSQVVSGKVLAADPGAWGTWSNIHRISLEQETDVSLFLSAGCARVYQG